jgi:hypothetical protein
METSTITDQRTIIPDSLADADLFARAILRLDLHDGQGEILYEASRPGRRRRIAVRAPNGAGKDDRIIAPLALWWMRRYRRGQVVITTADEKQLSNQTWRSLSAHRHLFGDFPTWRDHDHLIATPTGGRLSAFVTDEAKRAEGYHEKAPAGPLLMIINEAKSVPDELFDAFNRCSYNLLLEISTGGLMQGWRCVEYRPVDPRQLGRLRDQVARSLSSHDHLSSRGDAKKYGLVTLANSKLEGSFYTTKGCTMARSIMS